MEYYCLACKAGCEELNIKHLKALFAITFPEGHLNAFSPRKNVKEFKAKQWKMVNQPMLPGYIIIETDVDISEFKPELRRLTDSSYGLVRGSEKNYALKFKDRDYAIWICSLGGLVSSSRVMKVKNIKEGDKIVVLSGPMKDFKGRIVSIYKNTRATCEFEFLGSTKRVNLPIEIVENSKEEIEAETLPTASEIIKKNFQDED